MKISQVMNFPYKIPYAGPSSFFYKRKYETHTGLDLHCPEGTEIFSILNGKVVAVENFTGESVGSPWWNETKAVVVDSSIALNTARGDKNNHYIVYGEIDPCVEPGQIVASGTKLGTVMTVLKKFKGTSRSMLHLEWYKQKKSVIVGEPFDFADLQETLFFNNMAEWSRIQARLENPTFLVEFSYAVSDLRTGDFLVMANGDFIVLETTKFLDRYGKWFQAYSLLDKKIRVLNSRNINGLLYRDGKIVRP